MAGSLPFSGEASTYSDWFVNRRTSNGDVYTHEGYSAALLPKSRWYAIPLGTLVRVTAAHNRSVVVKINDRGAGTGDEGRVLDLSRAAYAYLMNRTLNSVTDKNAGVIWLSLIQVVPPATPLGPVSIHSKK